LVCHRDFKLENLLLRDEGDDLDACVVKIVDFGLARTFKAGQSMKSLVGTPYYVAPEVLAGSYTQACDIWSCGVVAYILLCGSPPFRGETDAETLALVRKGKVKFDGEVWAAVSEDAKDLIRRQLELDPDQRYTAAQAAAHDWISNQAPSAEDVPLQQEQLTNMRSFCRQNNLKKAAVRVVAQQLGEEDIKTLKDMFATLDGNSDGVITYQELQQGIEKLEGSAKGVMDMISDIDVNWNRRINYGEFLAAALDKKYYQQERACWQAFQVFDRDCSGSISRNELLKVLHDSDVETLMGSLAISRVMQQCDSDGDGSISFIEFMDMMRSS